MSEQIPVDEEQVSVEKLKGTALEYIESDEEYKRAYRVYRDAVLTHPKYEDWKDASETAKRLRQEIIGAGDIAKFKDNLQSKKERRDLLAEIIAAKLKEQQLDLFDLSDSGEEFGGRIFRLLQKLKVKKARKKKK